MFMVEAIENGKKDVLYVTDNEVKAINQLNFYIKLHTSLAEANGFEVERTDSTEGSLYSVELLVAECPKLNIEYLLRRVNAKEYFITMKVSGTIEFRVLAPDRGIAESLALKAIDQKNLNLLCIDDKLIIECKEL